MSRRIYVSLTIVFTVVVALSMGVRNPAIAAPPNDEISDAEVIIGLPYTTTVDTIEATRNSSTDYKSCDRDPFFTVWYKFTPSGSIPVRFLISDGTFDAMLTIYTGNVSDGMVELYEQYCTTIPQSNSVQFDFTLNEGFTYFIRISSYISDPYADPVPVATGGTLQLSIDQIPGPANDNFADATLIETTSMPYSDNQDITYASLESGEPIPSCAWWGNPGKTIWYSFTPGSNGLVEGNAGNLYENFLAVYTVIPANGLSEVMCQNYGGGFSFNAQAGETYYFQVGSLYGASGWLSIYLNFIAPPPNDNFADALLVTEFPYSHGEDNRAATLEANEPTPSCAQWNSPDKTIWYSFTPASNGLIEGNAGSWFSFLAVYTSNSLSGLHEEACQYYGNWFSLSVQKGTTYYFQVGSLWGYAGSLSIYLNFTPAPPNDNFADAMLVSELPFAHDTDNRTATFEAGEPIPNCLGSADKTVWFAFTPTQSGSVSTGISAWFPAFVAVYTESSPGSLTNIDCGAWGSIVTIPYNAGTTYYFQVGSVWGDSGPLHFELYETPPPNASFSFWPGDPSSFDNIYFSNESQDPYNEGISSAAWDFGDGSTSTEYYPYHRYGADGDYTVRLQVWTPDGRSAETTRLVQVRTHDVAITKFTVPQSASTNQTRTITVGIRNTRYPENVTVELYKSTPSGWQWVGTLNQYVPLRPSNRTTNFAFKYTFTNDDATMKKVSFRAVAFIQGYRDALPGDNEAISLPTNVTK